MTKTSYSNGIILNSIFCKVFTANSKKTDQLKKSDFNHVS